MMLLVRSLVFNAVYFSLTFALALYGVVFCRRSQRHAFALGRLWAKLSLRAARLICGIRFSLAGGAFLPGDEAALIASQHQSAYDTMVWFLLVPRVTYVMKQEVAQIPLFGRLTLLGGMIAVDRAGGAASLRGLMAAAAESAADGRQIVLFPEGTRAPPGVASPLHPGIAAVAGHTGLKVIAVSTDSGYRWGRNSFFKRPGTVHMQVHPPLPAGLPRRALMSALEQAFAPASEHPDGVPVRF